VGLARTPGSAMLAGMDALARLREASEPRLEVDPSVPAPGRVALLSGSFDPVTVGHLGVAAAALATVADLVVLVYAAARLPKEPGAPPGLLPESDRIAALEAVCAGDDRLALGLTSHGLLVDQVRGARRRFPVARLTVLAGSDKAVQLLDPRWYVDRDADLAALFAAAQLRVAVRTGEDVALAAALARPENARWAPRFLPLEVDPAVAGVSSRLVRERIRRGEDVTALVPPAARSFLGA
jgi:nicotinic acid mononucleotide adenylyltransferase